MFSLAWKNIIRRLGWSLMTALIAFIAVLSWPPRWLLWLARKMD